MIKRVLLFPASCSCVPCIVLPLHPTLSLRDPVQAVKAAEAVAASEARAASERHAAALQVAVGEAELRGQLALERQVAQYERELDSIRAESSRTELACQSKLAQLELTFAAKLERAHADKEAVGKEAQTALAEAQRATEQALQQKDAMQAQTESRCAGSTAAWTPSRARGGGGTVVGDGDGRGGKPDTRQSRTVTFSSRFPQAVAPERSRGMDPRRLSDQMDQIAMPRLSGGVPKVGVVIEDEALASIRSLDGGSRTTRHSSGGWDHESNGFHGIAGLPSKVVEATGRDGAFSDVGDGVQARPAAAESALSALDSLSLLPVTPTQYKGPSLSGLLGSETPGSDVEVSPNLHSSVSFTPHTRGALQQLDMLETWHDD